MHTFLFFIKEIYKVLNLKFCFKYNNEGQFEYQSYVKSEAEYQKKLNDTIQGLEPKSNNHISSGFCWKCRQDMKLQYLSNSNRSCECRN